MKNLLGLVLVSSCAVQLAQSGMVHAQVTYGGFRGIVTDPSGAAIPGVSVTVVLKDRGFTKTVVSGLDGAYEIPSPPGGTLSPHGGGAGVEEVRQREPGLVFPPTCNMSISSWRWVRYRRKSPL